MKSFLWAVVVVCASGCMGALGEDGTGGGAGGAGGGATTGGGAGGGGGGASASDGGTDGLPCDVAAVVVSHCKSCHGSPTSGGAPSTLLSRADFLRTSTFDPSKSEGLVSLERMQNGSMPPGGGVPAADLAVFASWVNGGLQAGSCGSIDAGSSMPSCPKGTYQPTPTAADPHDSSGMAPGWACISCHSGQNFANQNPGGAMRASGEIYQYMGTVFSTQHELDLCQSSLPSGWSIEITDGTTGNLVVQLPVRVSRGVVLGNFYGDAPGVKPASYKAKLVRPDGSTASEMVGAQTNGDCNTCHTSQGLSGAPGRIYTP